MRGPRRDPEGVEVRALVRHPPLDGARVLDIGCGDGRLTRRIAGIVRSGVGIDPDPEQIARAARLVRKSLRRKVRFRVGQAEALPFPKHSFDVAIFSWSL